MTIILQIITLIKPWNVRVGSMPLFVKQPATIFTFHFSGYQRLNRKRGYSWTARELGAACSREIKLWWWNNVIRAVGARGYDPRLHTVIHQPTVVVTYHDSAALQQHSIQAHHSLQPFPHEHRGTRLSQPTPTRPLHQHQQPWGPCSWSITEQPHTTIRHNLGLMLLRWPPLAFLCRY